MLKKKWLAAFSLTISSLGIAGTMGSICTSVNSTVPCTIKQWDMGIEALYLKPIYDARSAYHPGVTGHFKEIDNQWNWGFRLDGSYHFNTGNDISLDWSHYDATTNSSSLNFSIANRFDRANLVLGQHIDFSQLKSTRFYSGLQYSNIHVDHLQNALSLPPLVNQHNNTDFNGVGPIFGVDFAYAIGRSGLSVTANTATSILYGSSRNNIRNSLASGLVQSSSYASSKSIVPGIEEKLGLNYKYQFAQGLLTLDGGYQALNYFNALTRIQATTVINNDFGLYGPYFGVRWLGVS